MWSFFHGWRRKAGVVTLVIACGLICGWVSSHFVRVEFRTPIFDSLNVISTAYGGIEWSVIPEYRRRLKPADVTAPLSIQPLNGGALWVAGSSLQYPPYWQWCGFKLSITTWTIPYWFTVVPLLVVAICLFEAPYPVADA